MRASVASEPRERSEPAKRRASERVGESEGRSPSVNEEERQLLRQQRLHGVLHGWLIVHVPLSFALMALAVIHIVMALRF